MVKCKKCKSENIVKNGKVRGKQRYLCKDCRYNFVEGDARTNEKIKAKKAMCVCNMDKERHPLICWQKSMTHGLPLSIDG